MKKVQKILCAAAAATLTAGSVLALTACQTPEPLTDKAPSGTTVADFTQGEADAFFASDGWCNGDVFNVTWKKANAEYTDGAAKLSITEAPSDATVPYYGGEIRSYQHFGYGDYIVRMKPAKTAGTASTFFTYTGPSEEDEDGNPNPHDEIDIEFLGKDTTKVQFNFFTNGEGGNEYMYDLGFDASLEYHDYGFRWAQDYIVWFVDGVPVYKVTATADKPIPSTPGRILMNHWCGTEDAEAWMGKYSGGTATSDYVSVKTSALPIGEIPEKVVIEEFEGDWSTIDALELEYTSSDNNHTIESEGAVSHVTYAGVKGDSYSNVYAIVAEQAEDKNWAHATIKNNSTEKAVSVRVNIVNGGENIHALNSYAFVDGEPVSNNAGEGTIIEIAAGETVDVEIKFVGVANAVEFMLDSFTGMSSESVGDVTISNVKFAAQGEIIIPVEPESVNNGVTVNGTNIKFGGNTGGDFYIINTDDETNSMNVTYAKIAGNTWMNINAPIADIAVGKTSFIAKITNNGDKAVLIRVDIQGTLKPANTDCTNISATATDGVEVYTDTSWGGSSFTLGAGASTEITVTYTSNGPQGTAKSLMFYIDSSSGDAVTSSGDVTFSEMSFEGEEEVTPYEPEIPEVPEGDNCSLVFTSTDLYTVDKSGEAAQEITVVYDNMTGGTYANIQASATTLAAGNDTFSLKITNNGDEAVTVRVDLIGEQGDPATVGKTDVCNLSATAIGGSGLYTDVEYGGTVITVAAGEEVTLIIAYSNDSPKGAVQRVQFYLDSSTYGDTGTYGGNVTFGEFKFSSSDDGEAPETPVEPNEPDTPVVDPEEPDEPVVEPEEPDAPVEE